MEYKSEGKEIRYRVWDITGDGYLIGGGSIYDINTLNLKFRIKEGKKEESAGLRILFCLNTLCYKEGWPLPGEK